MLAVKDCIEKAAAESGLEPLVRYDEPMALHTTFKVGGPADVWVRPEGDRFPEYTAALLTLARDAGIPVFILGGGANIVVADRGIRGIVLDTGGWTGWKKTSKETAQVRSGTSVDTLGNELAAEGLSGLEFLAGMPGSVGGAVWMNARCYEKSVSDMLVETEFLELPPAGRPRRLTIPFKTGDFDYKKSPFQGRNGIILSAGFRLQKRPLEEIKREMADHRRDREEKGHYRYPCAGSAFKNNRDFGKPMGKIIDELGLRGFSIGGAQAAPFHGNIIINTGNATAEDIWMVTEE
ncbi:MAG: UDP-N-acetylmuramate dehydrogenase, partial [Treponema sp.]|nr:UDP-N-acetylmuramate dehydrogenase [Treponema sp.]